ncbi:MAG TPA: nuclear transport factor 2 family protein [Pelobium sp.]
MKKTILFFLLISATSINLKAQDKKAEVEKTISKLIDALISGNKVELEAIADESLTYGHSNGKLQNKKEFVQGLVSKQSDFVSIDITNQNILIEGNTAIVTHNLYAKTNDSGKPGEVKLGIMLVLIKKKNGDWKLLARQAYRI